MASLTPDPGWWLLHVDLDQYVVAVEVRRRPELRGLPVVVGGSGDPTRPRQVAASASYEARAFGVRSGMPLRAAARKCPEAIFLPADNRAYDEASHQVMDVVRSFGYPTEVWGWDEAIIGARIDDPEGLASDLRSAILGVTALACSVGIGDTKERAKMATGFAKPDGVYRLWSENWTAVMAERPVRELWGIGGKTAGKLAEQQIYTIAELAAADHRVLAGRFGPTIGPSLKLLAMGGASTSIATEQWIAKSRSKQTTYPTDLTDPAQIADAVNDLATALADDVRTDGRIVTHVGVTVRTSSFYTRTKTGKLAAPTSNPEDIRHGAGVVLDRFDITHPVRLLGVRVDLQDMSPR